MAALLTRYGLDDQYVFHMALRYAIKYHMSSGVF